MQEWNVPDDAFTGVDESLGQFGGGDYEGPGHTIQRVDVVRFINKRKGGSGVAIEKTYLKIIHAPAEMHDNNAGLNAMKPYSLMVGQQVTDFINFDKDYGVHAMCSFIATCFGQNPKMVTKAHCKTACLEGQPCKGIILEVQGNERQTQSQKPIWITRLDYRRVVPALELAESLDEAGIALLGGDDGIVAMIEKEKAAAEA